MIIDFLTTTRADYGVLRPIIRKFNLYDDIDCRLLVTGTHLSNMFGYTLNEIEKDGFNISAKIPILSTINGKIDVSETMGIALTKFSSYFCSQKPDFLLVDGDRYEVLAVCIAAVNNNIPIIHIGGGATTEGALDEYYRHAITKLSYLHFATISTYKNRIIQMGENPNRVYLVGSPLIENILATDFISKEELECSLNFKLDMPFAVVTFHPVTLEPETALIQIKELLSACREVTNMKFIFTLSNADNGGEIINNEIKRFVDGFDRAVCVASLGATRYYSALKMAVCVIGNSSSGIIEVPSFNIPTINIGDRQKGRIQAESIINCQPNKREIIDAIIKSQSYDFLEVCKKATNPNGDGKTSEKMLSAIRKTFKDGIDLKKSFYDIR